MEDESVVYRQLAGSGLTAGNIGNASFSKNIDGVKDGLVLASENNQNFHDLKTVNDASFRTGNDMIPGTFTFAVETFVDNGTQTCLTPKEGEVWRIFYPIARVTAGAPSGAIQYELRLNEASTGIDYRVFLTTSSSAAPVITEDTSWDGEMLQIGHGTTLEAQVSSFSGTSLKFGVYAARVK